MENVFTDSVEESEVARRDERGRAGSGVWTRTLQLLVGAIATGTVFFYLQFSTDAILDVDGYYHIRWSRLLWEGMLAGKFPPAFPYLPLTTLNPQDYVDHHLLFHFLLIPFTWFGDLRLGAKTAAALYGTLGVLACYWLILRYRVKYPPVWLVALLGCSAPFLYRLSMTRAQSVSLIFMVAGIYLLFERRYWLLAPLAFLYVWTYSLFVMLCAASVIWAGVVLWSEWHADAKFIRRTLVAPLATAIGTVAGFVINPYFPDNIRLFVAHLLMKAKATEFTTSVGMEWYPYESWYLLGSCLVAFAAMLIGYVAFDGTDKKRAARTLFFLIFSTILLIITARSRRFVEYWPPFAVLFAAFSLKPLLEGERRAVGARLSAAVLDELRPFLDRHERPQVADEKRRRENWKMALAGVAAVALAIPMIGNIVGVAREIRNDQPPTAYRGAMEWVRTNVPKGEMVFNTDWDDFPKVFFYDTDHAYASGLDPTYLLNQNPELSKLYVDITLGKNNYDAGPVIRERFGARYVFSDKEEVHDDFYFKALDSGWFEKVYEDDYAAVLRIREQKGAPTPDSEGSNTEGAAPDATPDAEFEDDVDEPDGGVEEGAPLSDEGQPPQQP
ncbi:MAG: hypothetical protein M3458_05875 [Acidobacteriota bacterium]|nr:hypothetical protein [Acidobacteriota bacterium]